MQKFILGTYTKKESKGIYTITLDKQKKELKNLKLITTINNPTYLDFNNTEKIFSICDNGIAISKNEKIIDKIQEEKTTPCYISYCEKNNYIFSANYHTGEIRFYKLKENKLILKDIIINQKNKTQKVHAHYAKLTPNKKFLITCFLGTDEVIIYKIENEKLIKYNTYNSNYNAGARHIEFHPTKNTLYLICELDASIEVIKFNEDFSILTQIQKINLLNNTENKKWASAIKITKCGNYLYASNRGYDIISVFKINTYGKLKKIQEIQTYGEVARDFNLDNEEKFLIVGHQQTNNLTLFKRNSNGILELINSNYYAPEVVCIKPI